MNFKKKSEADQRIDDFVSNVDNEKTLQSTGRMIISGAKVKGGGFGKPKNVLLAPELEEEIIRLCSSRTINLTINALVAEGLRSIKESGKTIEYKVFPSNIERIEL